MKKHDEHYRQNIEPIEVIENRIENPGDVPAKAVYSISQAIKYLLRAGLKSEQPWKKDVEKAINYLTRALTGDWVGKTIIEGSVPADIVDVIQCRCGSVNDATRTTCRSCGTPLL